MDAHSKGSTTSLERQHQNEFVKKSKSPDTNFGAKYNKYARNLRRYESLELETGNSEQEFQNGGFSNPGLTRKTETRVKAPSPEPAFG